MDHLVVKDVNGTGVVPEMCSRIREKNSSAFLGEVRLGIYLSSTYDMETDSSHTTRMFFLSYVREEVFRGQILYPLSKSLTGAQSTWAV